MPLKPQSLEEFFEQQESLTREQSFKPGEIHRYVRKALALVDGNAEPLVLALVCIAIGMMVGEQTGRAIIQDGYRTAKKMKNTCNRNTRGHQLQANSPSQAN